MSTTRRELELSIIVPTRNRQTRLQQTVACLAAQDQPASTYEIIIVDDGSTPPVSLPPQTVPQLLVLRLEGGERTAARNRGAAVARGRILIFVDDDIMTGRGFVKAHCEAHQTWSEAIVVGTVELPSIDTEFMHFRRHIESQPSGLAYGPVDIPLYSAANMSMERQRFMELGGFDQRFVTGEDQDQMLRHRKCGGITVFAPHARGLHVDGVEDVRTWCQRTEVSARTLVHFGRAYPYLPQNLQRHRINGWHEWQRDFPLQSMVKLLKNLLSLPFAMTWLWRLLPWFENRRMPRWITHSFYRYMLGLHTFRGYRAGLRLEVSKVNEELYHAAKAY